MISVLTKRVQVRSFCLAMCFCTISLCTSLYLLCDNSQPVEYKFLFLMPLFYAVLALGFCDLYGKHGNIGIYAVILLEFFRLVLIPLFLCLGDYYSAMINTRSPYITPAIILTGYEAICVFLTMECAHSRDAHSAANTKHKLKSNALKWILISFVLFLFVVAIFFPRSVTAFKTIFDFGSDDFTTWSGLSVSSKYDAGSIDRILGTLFTMIFSWIRYLLPVGIIIWSKRRIRSELVAILIALLLVMAQMMFITATIMDGILCGFVMLIVLGKVYPDKKRLLIGLSMFAFLFVVGFYFLSRFLIRFGSGGNAWQFISENAIAYVGGIDNVAAAMNLPDEGKWSTFFYNIYGAIPFNSTLFGLKGDKLAAVFNAVNGRVDGQIPPTIGAGWYYYGYLYAPIESIIYTRVAVKFGSKASVEKNIWKYTTYVLISIMMVMGFTTYNSAIVLNYVTTLLIPLLILSRYTNDLEFELFV